jgi:hypothetical protein
VGVGGAPVPADQFVAQMTSAVCNGLGPCCHANIIGFDYAKCVSAVQGAYAPYFGKPGYDAQVGGNLIAKLRSVSATCSETPADAADIAKTAGRLFSGPKHPGEPCADDVDCALPPSGTAACVKAGGGPDGGVAGSSYCEQIVPATPGAACGPTPPNGVPLTIVGDCDQSNPDLYCNEGSGQTAGTCQPRNAIGQTCTKGACVLTAYCANGVCATPVGVGGRCTGPAFIEPSCDGASFCNLATGNCDAKKATGAACSDNVECQSGACFDRTGSKNRVCLQNPIGTPQLCTGA